MVLPGPARLSLASLTWLLETERIGRPHLVLEPAAVWHPPAELDALHAQARAEIAALGWYDRRRRLDIEVAVTLPMLCRAESECFGWITRNIATIGVLAAATGRHGLLAVREGDAVWLNRIGRGRLAETVAAQTADVAAGPGKPMTVFRRELAATVRGQRLTEAAVRVGPARVAVRRIREIAALPLLGKGELYAAACDGVGRYRVSEPLRYADTPNGRYLNLTVGPDQLLVAPAGRADLADRLRELCRSVTR
jgi:hypothetical protein